MNDKINPTYYDGDACMRLIEDATRGLIGHEAFCVGQVIKYMWRAGTKPGEEFDVDRNKARWYYDRLVVHGPARPWPVAVDSVLLSATGELFDLTDPQQIRQRLLALPQVLLPCVENLPLRIRS